MAVKRPIFLMFGMILLASCGSSATGGNDGGGGGKAGGGGTSGLGGVSGSSGAGGRAGGAGGGGGAVATGGAAGGGGAAAAGGAAGTGGSSSDGGACTTPLALLPPAIYAMLDQSSSMSDSLAGGQATKWMAVGSGIEAFLAAPGSASFGLQYFGLAQSCPVTCNVDADCGGCGPCETGICLGGGDSCTAADYAMPEVEIAPAQSVATSVMASLATHSPSTGSPTSAALQGAVDHAAAYAAAHANADVVALLITDGDPSECDTNTGDIDMIASTALGGAERVRTAVISLGASQLFVDAIAQAGGTDSAIAPTTVQGISMALTSVATERCALPIPANSDTATLRLQTDEQGAIAPLGNVASAAACNGASGFYFDSATAPHRILLCPASCTALRSSTTLTIEALTCP